MGTERTIRLGGLVLLVAALFSSGFHHWDEHFQVLEFAGWKLGITPTEALPWEFAARLRPALQPLLVVGLYQVLALFSPPDPFMLTMLLRMGMAALSFLAMVMLVRGALRSEALLEDPGLRGWYLFLSFFLWPVVYNAVRFSSEGFTTALFLMGFTRMVYIGDRNTSGALFTGLLLGLAFVVRYQTGFLIGGLLAWGLLVRRDTLHGIAPLMGGILLATGLGILADRWFYGTWTLTIWTYFEQNILAGKASSFGTEPWWDYFTEVFTRAVPPFSLLFLVPPLLVFIFRPRHALTWTVLPFLVVHLAIGHKEVRFLFPLLGLLPLLSILGLGVLRDRWWPGLTSSRSARIAARTFALVHVPLLLVIMLKPADDQIALYRTVFRNFPEPITVVHDGEHPYHRVADIHFYRRPGMTFRDTAAMRNGLVSAPFLYITMQREAPDPSWGVARAVYTSFPDWLTRFNLGGWVDRTDRWSVYHITSGS